MTDLCDLTASELRQMIGRKDISPIELVESCIDRIENVDGQLNAMVTKSYERARAEARDAEQAVVDGEELGMLHGLPVGIKDLERLGIGTCKDEAAITDEDLCFFIAGDTATGTFVEGPFPCNFHLP